MNRLAFLFVSRHSLSATRALAQTPPVARDLWSNPIVAAGLITLCGIAMIGSSCVLIAAIAIAGRKAKKS